MWLVLTGLWLRWPSNDELPDTVDAVVVFAGGRGERLRTALEVMDTGVSPVLVIMNGEVPGWGRANRVCADPELPYDVRCPFPDPDTTRGEAQTISAIAETEGWDDLVVVTSDYHLHRSRTLLDRCHDGEVFGVGGVGDLGVADRTRLILREWIGVASTWVVRNC